MKTKAPSSTNSLAVANPIPLLPPVMTAILPLSFLDMAFLRCCRVVTNSPSSDSFVLWESLSEHGSATFRLLFCGLILNDVPMLDQDPVLYAKNVRCNPVHRLAEARKSPVHDHKIFIGQNHSSFILQRWRDALDEIKQAVATGRDMSAVLNVVGRPIALSRYVVTLIEQCIESFKHK